VKKLISGLVMATLMTASLAALAEGGGDTLAAHNAQRIVQINQHLEQDARTATAQYAQRVNKPMPEIEDYHYGMGLHVAKLVHVSPAVKYCGNVNNLMSYEDSKGALHLVRYLGEGDCISNR